MILIVFSQIYKLADDRKPYSEDEIQTYAYSKKDIEKIFSVLKDISIGEELKKGKGAFGNIKLEWSKGLIKVYYKNNFSGCAFENDDNPNAIYYKYNEAEILVMNTSAFIYNGKDIICLNFLEYKGGKPTISIGIAEHSIKIRDEWTKLPNFVIYITDKADYSEGYRYLVPIGVNWNGFDKRFVSKYKVK
jgi:hypothetical protein